MEASSHSRGNQTCPSMDSLADQEEQKQEAHRDEEILIGVVLMDLLTRDRKA